MLAAKENQDFIYPIDMYMYLEAVQTVNEFLDKNVFIFSFKQKKIKLK